MLFCFVLVTPDVNIHPYSGVALATEFSQNPCLRKMLSMKMFQRKRPRRLVANVFSTNVFHLASACMDHSPLCQMNSILFQQTDYRVQ